MTLDQLRALCDTASPGPWEHDGKFTVSIERGNEMTAFRTYREDAAFIAAARTALPLLIAVAEAASKIPGEVLWENVDCEHGDIWIDVPGHTELRAALAALEAAP